MPLLQQIIQLLTEAPYNLVYHLITLLTVQVVLGIALGQWVRNRDDEVARRLALGAAAILFTRLVLAVTIALLNRNELLAVRYLPPLEQAVNTITLIGLIWAVAPTVARFPRFIELVVFLLTLATGVVYIVFALDWSRRTSTAAYNSDFQATVWGASQLILLVAGVGLVLMGRGRDWLLRLFTLLPLLAAHFIHQWNYPEFFVVETEVPYLIRLGQLIAFPLLTVVAYRHVLGELTQPTLITRTPSAPPLVDLLQLATQVIEPTDSQRTRQEAAAMVAHLLNPAFVGLAVPTPDNPDQLHVTLLRPRLEQDHYQAIFLTLADWPTLGLALREGTATALVPQGMGHQQIQRLYQQAGLEELGPLLIEPLLIRNRAIGLLLVAGKPGQSEWSAKERSLVSSLAYYLAHVLDRVHLQEQTTHAVLPLAGTEREGLEKERDDALTQRQQWEIEVETTQVRLADLEQKQLQTKELEKEVAALREALNEAEEAMALAAAGSTNLSAEWVTRTVTRYSGELEEAQTRIEMLERALHHRDREPTNDLLVGLIQELRTPMTSISGYTDLLLSETMGILGGSQRDFLQRIRANAERTNTMLEQLIRVATQGEPEIRREVADVLSIIETAIDVVAPQLRQKRLRLDLHLEDLLGQWQFNRDALYQVMVHLLSNACQASPSDMPLRIDGRLETVRETIEGVMRENQLLHLSVTDSGGGIATEDLPHVFEPHVETDAPLIAGLGDTGIGLAVARQIITANQGRIWVEGKPGVGSTFSVLLPLNSPTAAAAKPSANGSKKLK
ncbi:MAG: GAF domain-containing sensor histidine kinase [Chloroflexi bacterium]|nr:GAF domain-containing sensor histidine kinase [Chloroflexota bacterium]